MILSREVLKHLIKEELDKHINKGKVVSGNVGDPDTDAELAILKQGIQTGNLTKEQLRSLSAILSHNLRTPWTSIDGRLQLAQYDADNDDMHAAMKDVRIAIEALKTGAKRLTELATILSESPPQED